jgi:hypothetical protein
VIQIRSAFRNIRVFIYFIISHHLTIHHVTSMVISYGLHSTSGTTSGTLQFWVNCYKHPGRRVSRLELRFLLEKRVPFYKGIKQRGLQESDRAPPIRMPPCVHSGPGKARGASSRPVGSKGATRPRSGTRWCQPGPW